MRTLSCVCSAQVGEPRPRGAGGRAGGRCPSGVGHPFRWGTVGPARYLHTGHRRDTTPEGVPAEGPGGRCIPRTAGFFVVYCKAVKASALRERLPLTLLVPGTRLALLAGALSPCKEQVSSTGEVNASALHPTQPSSPVCPSPPHNTSWEPTATTAPGTRSTTTSLLCERLDRGQARLPPRRRGCPRGPQGSLDTGRRRGTTPKLSPAQVHPPAA